MNRRSMLVALAAFGVALVGCGGCGGETARSTEGAAPAETRPLDGSLTIVSGSGNKGLEPVVKEFARREGVEIGIEFLGSVDISLELQKGAAIEYDAVWPANSLWVVLGDRDKVVKHEKSIMRSPVVFGVKQSVAERLGWVDKNDLRVVDILDAAEAGKLRFAMTSATQSNSGASAYLGFLSAMAGSPDVLQQTHLDDDGVRSQVRRLLLAVDRSSGSSGWLKDMMLERYSRFDAMVNYEALIIEANRQLNQRGDEPLYAVYPIDGMTIADSPLGYVDKGQAAKEKIFLALQEYLLSSQVQSRIGELGRRTGLVGLSGADPTVFRKEWGIDTERVISPVAVPEEQVVKAALDLYQTALRKPSITAYVLDFSGSMKGTGEAQLKDAMSTLFDSATASRYLLQASADDVHIVIPFDGRPRNVWVAEGNRPEVMRQLLNQVLDSKSAGGTNIYTATALALGALQRFEEKLNDYFPAIILMSDGKSKEAMPRLRSQLERVSFGYDVPIFTIAFGNAQPSQLEALSELSSGRYFDGKKDLVKAFRQAKGYN